MSKITLLQGDAIDMLKTLPDKSVHTCICSPPFYSLRDYGTGTWEGGQPDCQHTMRKAERDNKATGDPAGRVYRGKRDVCLHCGARRIDHQIGLEESPEDYVARLVEVFRDLWRVLRDDGTLWLNLGETWASRGGPEPAQSKWQVDGASNTQNQGKSRTPGRLKEKDMIGIPWMVAFALRADGWYLRQDIIWFAPNKKPESVKDRPTTSHEHVFLLAKQRHYYYDGEAVKVEGAGTLPWGNKRNFKQTNQAAAGRHGKTSMFAGGTKEEYIDKWYSDKVQRRSVWSIPTKPYKGAHFAPFPEALVEPCLLAGTSERGCCPACGAPWKRITERVDKGYDGSKYGERMVAATGGAISGGTAKSTLGSSNGKLTGDSETVGWQPSCKCPGDLEPIACTAIDPFMGSGTVGAVCVKHHRDFIGIDLSADYLTLAEERIGKTQPLLLEIL